VRPNITLLMVLCGIVSAAAAGAVSAATLMTTCRLVVRYNAESLATESGARALYRRLGVRRASLPRADTGPFVSSTILHCASSRLPAQCSKSTTRVSRGVCHSTNTVDESRFSDQTAGGRTVRCPA